MIGLTLKNPGFLGILSGNLIEFDPGFSGGFNAVLHTVALQPDGKIIAGGEFTAYNDTIQYYITRLNSDGSRDTSFDAGSGFNFTARAVAVQSDSKIIVGGVFTSYNGTTQNRITRLNSDGSRDTGFNTGTGLNGASYTVAVQSDGKILIGGEFTSYDGTTQNRITRLNSDGSRDTEFNTGTGFDITIFSILVQSDGKILVGGYFFNYNGTTQNNVIRLNSDGTRDTGFEIGTGPNDYIYDMAIQPDGKILLVGGLSSYNGTTQNRITRLNSDGSRDTSFNIGTGFNFAARTVAVQSDGKILIGGEFTSYDGTTQNRITRLNSDGSRDTEFNTGTGFNDDVLTLNLQVDGKILAGGRFVSYNGTSKSKIIRLIP